MLWLTRLDVLLKTCDHCKYVILFLCASISVFVQLTMEPRNVWMKIENKKLTFIYFNENKSFVFHNRNLITVLHHSQLFPILMLMLREQMCVHWHWKNLILLMILKVRSVLIDLMKETLLIVDLFFFCLWSVWKFFFHFSK